MVENGTGILGLTNSNFMANNTRLSALLSAGGVQGNNFLFL